MPGTKKVHKQLGKGNNYREISGKFGVVASTAYEKVNTTGADENLFRISSCAWARCPRTTSGASTRARPGTVPKLVLGHQQKAMFRLVRKSEQGLRNRETALRNLRLRSPRNITFQFLLLLLELIFLYGSPVAIYWFDVFN